MKKYGILTLAALLALALDTALFPAWSLAGIRPWVLLALALAATACLNVQTGIVLALLGGLIEDAVCNSYLGLAAACWLVSVSVLWLLIRKNHPKAFVLLLYAALVTALPAPIEWLYSYLAGAHFNGLYTLITVVLPSALLTGVCTLPLCRLLNEAKKSRRDRI